MARILNLFGSRRRRMDEELERELQHHLETRIDVLVLSGLSQSEARRQAALEFGGIARVQEEVRETWTWYWIDALVRDTRHAVRTLLRNRGFAIAGLFSLGLGISASTAIFSLVDQLLMRGLPVRESDRVVQVAWQGNSLTASWGGGHLMSYPLCLDLQEREQVFEGVFCRSPATVSVSVGSHAERRRAELVSGSYFHVLGVTPLLGRLIDESDDRRLGASPVAVLSHNFWQNDLGGASDVIGSTLLVRNQPFTVIGIAPADFAGMDALAPTAVWIPATMAPQAAPLETDWDGVFNRRVAWMHVFGRLKPGVTAENAKSQLRPWFRAMLEAESRADGFDAVSADDRRDFLASTLEVLPAGRGVSNLRNVLERPLLIMAVGSGLLLLLGCINVAGLLLARGAARSHELSTRVALGASRRRVTTQLLVESTLIALVGGVFGLLAAPVLSRVLLALLTYSDDIVIRFDYRAFAFALNASVVTATLCGVAPLVQTRRIPPAALLREGARSTSGGRIRFRKTLVAVQLALTLVLLVAAGLFVQTVRNLVAEAGFDADSQVLFSVSPTAIGYSEEEAERAMRELIRHVGEIPAVESVAIANTSLLSGGWSARTFTIQSEERIVSDRPVPFMRVGPGFFATLGTQVVLGRDFDERDVRAPGNPPRDWQSVIVNESFVRRYFDGRNPVGHRLAEGNEPGAIAGIEIIGVVRDFSRRRLRDGPIEQAFFPYWDRDSDGGTFYVRVRGNPGSVFDAIRESVVHVDPALSVSSIITLSDQVDRSMWTERTLARLVTASGAVAVLLSVVGLYGVMSFVVAQRRREVGLRIALGATRLGTLWLIMREALSMAGAGIMIALPGMWAVDRVVEAQLFGIRTFDGPTAAAAIAVLAMVAFCAAIGPAWRAASIEPNMALRLE